MPIKSKTKEKEKKLHHHCVFFVCIYFILLLLSVFYLLSNTLQCVNLKSLNMTICYHNTLLIKRNREKSQHTWMCDRCIRGGREKSLACCRNIYWIMTFDLSDLHQVYHIHNIIYYYYYLINVSAASETVCRNFLSD